MSKFSDKYALPEPATITLEDVTFTVQLPTSANKRYERAIASASAVIDAETGDYTTREFTLAQMIEVQQDQFIEVCVLDMDGEDFDRTEFIAKYPAAVDDLYQQARKLVDAMEETATAEVGKLQPSSPGQESGATNSTSTKALKKQAG